MFFKKNLVEIPKENNKTKHNSCHTFPYRRFKKQKHPQLLLSDIFLFAKPQVRLRRPEAGPLSSPGDGLGTGWGAPAM